MPSASSRVTPAPVIVPPLQVSCSLTTTVPVPPSVPPVWVNRASVAVASAGTFTVAVLPMRTVPSPVMATPFSQMCVPPMKSRNAPSATVALPTQLPPPIRLNTPLCMSTVPVAVLLNAALIVAVPVVVERISVPAVLKLEVPPRFWKKPTSP